MPRSERRRIQGNCPRCYSWPAGAGKRPFPSPSRAAYDAPFPRGQANHRLPADPHGFIRSRPYVRCVKHLAVRPTACPIRGLRRIGRRRASDMGDGPDARYHLRGNGCPQSDDFDRSCRWGARWGSTSAWQFSESRRSRRQACRAPEHVWMPPGMQAVS